MVLSNILQRNAINSAVHPHAHVVVLPVHEIREGGEKRFVERRLRRGEPFLRLSGRFHEQNRFQLLLQCRRDGEEIRRIAREEIQFVQRVESLQLLDRIRRVVHADVDVAVVPPRYPPLARTTSSAADCIPRWSPPPACPATSAAISRSASEPRLRSNVSAMFRTVASDTMMLAWAA